MEESLSLPEFDWSCMTICDTFGKEMGHPQETQKKVGGISQKRRAANDVEMLTG